MKKRILISTALLSAAFLFCAAGNRSAGRGGGRAAAGAGPSRGAASPAGRAASGAGSNIFKMRHVAVSQPQRFERPEHVVNDRFRAVEPKSFERGEAIRQPRETRPPAQHSQITGNAALVRGIQDEQRRETLNNHYYWHNDGGVRYAHYYDNHGVHWYGFYHGPRFYWSRYYLNNWWWYDTAFDRWSFWWDGYWWWWGPGGIAYVYIDNDYYPYDMASGGVTVQKPETTNPPNSPPPLGEGQIQVSRDNSRLVQIYGGNSEAFLYDNSGAKPVYISYLGRDIVKVKFTEGDPVQIIADFKDGAFAVYDMDGHPKNTPPSEPPKAAEPPPAASVPPVPASAPGQ